LSIASAARAEGADLIHLFGHRHVHQFELLLEEAKRRGTPIVASPLLDDVANEAMWGGSAIRTMFMGVRDDLLQDLIENGLAKRRLLVSGGSERGKCSYDAAALANMFKQSGALIFSSAAEEARARTQFPFGAATRVVPCVTRGPVPTEPIGALCGIDEYVLLHGMIEPRGNQFMAVRAAAAASLPCVLLGTVNEIDYYYGILPVGGSQFICLSEDTLSAGQIEAIYAGARVYADLAWAGYGAERLVRAAAHGALPVVSTSLQLGELWPEVTGGVDPASVESATAVLRAAWMRAPVVSHQIAERTAQIADPLRSLQAVLGAYAEAAAVKAV
jgi:hypothetical protein